MLDVHVLVMDYTPRKLLDQCLESISIAADRAGVPVSVHAIPGIVGFLGRARFAGYSLGMHPYVTHVDDDDYLAPDAFAALVPAMSAGHDAITTGETLIFEPSGRAVDYPQSRHHLAVFRRDRIKPLAFDQFRFYPDQYLLSRFDPLHIPECLYFHRINADSGSRRQRRANKEEAAAELALINRKDLAVTECMTSLEIAVANDLELARG